MKKLNETEMRKVEGGKYYYYQCAYGCKGHSATESPTWHYFFHLIGVYKP